MKENLRNIRFHPRAAGIIPGHGLGATLAGNWWKEHPKEEGRRG